MNYPKIINLPVNPYFTDNNLKKVNDKEKATYRFSLVLDSKFNVDNDVLVLMMNPSDADQNNSDETTNKLISSLNNQIKFNKLITINVFPMIRKNSDELLLQDFIYSNLTKNTSKIRNLLNNPDFNISKVIIATGEMQISTKHIDHKIINKEFIYRYKKIIEQLNNCTKSYDLYTFGELTLSKKFSRHPKGLNLGERLRETHINFNQPAYIN